jgi:hypothetical protein
MNDWGIWMLILWS